MTVSNGGRGELSLPTLATKNRPRGFDFFPTGARPFTGSSGGHAHLSTMASILGGTSPAKATILWRTHTSLYVSYRQTSANVTQTTVSVRKGANESHRTFLHIFGSPRTQRSCERPTQPITVPPPPPA